MASPAVAHKVEVAGDVAATFHLEPHHSPKAGEPAQVWFALTRKGGAIIPLAQCNCKLAVHLQPDREGSKPLLEPVLQATTAERYQGIPGAEIVFPKPGVYELELRGTPKAGGSFQPFELSYKVIVGAGSTPAGSPTAQTARQSEQAEQPPAQWQIPVAVGAVVVGIGAIVFWVRKSKS
ncbi:MAG: hypothetical protein KME35_10880 [Aphanocapsa sp. GSE-SYN-MK-11-07L]|nr:hypothetical protein [Aphanocapsa sp. GSE-SYN-MK-11-07L]